MKTIDSEKPGEQGNKLLIMSATTAAALSILFSPALGIGAGCLVIACAYSIIKERPQINELVKLGVALIAALAIATLVNDWPDFKTGIVEGFRRCW